MKTIYLTEQGSQIHKENQRLVVERVNGELIPLLTKELKQIILFGNIQLTTPAISTCLQFQILVLFLSQTGKYKGQRYTAVKRRCLR